MYICEIKLNRLHRKIRVGAVSYLNTKPLVYGFEHGVMRDEVTLIYDYPSRIAAKLLNNEIDVGLVPVAIIPSLKESHIISDYCIATEKKVASVCIFSEVPFEDTEKLLLDYQSKTSVALAKLLVTEYWKHPVTFIDTKEDYRKDIRGTTAGLVIGDRAFQQRHISPFIYDLGEAWNTYTGLPFVFAAWVSNKPLAQPFIERFNEANNYGLQQLHKVIADNPYSYYNLETYFRENISYQLNEPKMQGMRLFLSSMASQVSA
jgi:chorismate dehydratase